MVNDRALELLRTMLGPKAQFKDGQLEAINRIVTGKRALVVEQTGWGKSIVYFIGTKIRREIGYGISLLISPLLALMRNQIENAEKIGIMAETINSDNQSNWENVKIKILNNQCDILLLSPERLANDDFRDNVLPKLSIGMFIVDEAHCISDWGHDFRPDYQRIVNVVKKLPANIPVIATTATANNRVVEDIKNQLGENIYVQRGNLVRESLKLQVIVLGDQAERLAWLAENLDKLPGTGIIYCLTTADCDKVSKWLKLKGHNVESYHAKLSKSNDDKQSIREEREKLLMGNKVKALAATVSLGMGFDKPDIGFVIHYQRPGNIVSYYQQIGRAGRGLKEAYAILLVGKEDTEIQEYFINTAFPNEVDMVQVLDVISDSENGLTINEIMNKVNMKMGTVKDKVLKFLLLQNAVIKEGSKYIRTLNPWEPDREKSQKITQHRYEELKKIDEYTKTKDCLMKFIAKELDDPFASDCGKCTNCIKKDYFRRDVDDNDVIEAMKFLKGDYIVIEPRKQWPPKWEYRLKGKINLEHNIEEGRVLCSYGDSGWGKYVKEDKYINSCFRNELVDASAELILKWDMEYKPTWVTSVPSKRRPELVSNFAERLAKKLGLKYYPIIEKVKDTPEQKKMQNSNMQASNILEAFNINSNCPSGPVLLIDDMVDSRWTFTVIGVMLRQSGSGPVYPFAIASTSGGDTND